MSETQELLQFPCNFPIKIMGENSDAFEKAALDIISEKAPETDIKNVSVRLSSKGNYRAISVVIKAQSREALDALYLALTSHPLVRVVL